MNLAKARQLLRQDRNYPGSVPIEDINIAEYIACEAMNWVELSRITNPNSTPALLPGETLD